MDQRRSGCGHQVYCGPAQVRFSTPSMLWTSAGPLLLIIQYAVVQCRSGFGSPSMLWTSAGPFFLIIQYVVVQCKSGFGPLNMLWTSTGPILLIKYIVDQRRSDFAHNIGDWVVYPKVVPSSFRSKTGAPKCPQGPNQWK